MPKHPEVKVGDKLLYNNRLLLVEKVTPTGIINCGRGISFRPDLYRRGAFCEQARLATSEILLKVEQGIKAKKAKNILYSIRWHDVPDEVILGTAAAYGSLMSEHAKKGKAENGDVSGR